MKMNKRMKWTSGLFVAGLLLLALVVTGCSASSGVGSVPVEASELEQNRTISVLGDGEAVGQPDRAQVTVGVETFAPEVNEATAENDEVLGAVLDSLDQEGIASEDVQTSNYSLWAEQRYGENGPEGIAGYHVSNQVTVVIRDVEKVGDVLAAVTAAGANSIYGIQFSVDDPVTLEAEAREKALDDAREKAESIASLSGLTLGSLLAIDETLVQYPSIYGGGGDGLGGGAMLAETSISPGQMSYRSQVQVTYSFSYQ